uniref:SH3 domain-containing protein n=1 Tax=Acetatifactor sp. TaxID=1872090 RepID=UPI004055E6FB
MKKKLIVSLLTTTMVVSILTGCGNEASTLAESSVAVEETVPSSEVVEYEANETEESESVVETEVVETEETEVIAETETVETEVLENEVVETEVDETEESQSAEETKVVETEEIVTEYTYSEMNKTMYAKSAVNLRDMPSTNGNKVGSLKSGQEVKVTGQCNETGWYRLEGNQYVSNNYLVTSKPVAQTTTNTTSNTSNTGDPSGYVSDAATSQEAQLLAGFVDILNAKRAEAGLSSVSGDSSLDATALNGAKELATNYSHQVAGGGYDRVNIGKSFGTPDVQTIFNAWWNSEGHKQQMMDPYLITASAAYYNGYVIFIGNINEETYSNDVAEKIDQQMQNGEMTQVGETQTDSNTGASVTTYGTEGAVSVADPDEAQALKDKWGW